MIFSLALYPYILLPVRLSLRGRAASLLKISRLAGRTRLRLWSDVLRALSMKAIYVGAIIIAMECLSEFGAVSMLGIDTFTTAIYTAWASFYSLEIAARLGLILMLFIIPLNLLEQRLKRTQLSSEVTKATEQRGSKLSSLWIATVIFFALVIPLLQLVSWLMTPVFHEVLRYDADAMISLSLMTIALGVLCGVIVYGLSLLLTIILRFYRKYLCFHTPRKWLNLSLYGYAIPGNLLAIAFLGVGQYFIASYSMFAALGLLVAALCLKFFRTCLKKAEVGDEFIDNSMVKVGRLHHEKRPFKFLKIVYVPMLNPYLFYGFLFVVIEVMKELPLTMILRPMGVNTLSTKLFELTSEGEWVSAAPYAMALLVICCLFHVTVSQVMMKKVSKAGAQ
jgi:iron(III) transport system permease protein